MLGHYRVGNEINTNIYGRSFLCHKRRQTYKPYHLSLSLENTTNSVHRNAPTEKLIPWHQRSKRNNLQKLGPQIHHTGMSTTALGASWEFPCLLMLWQCLKVMLG